MRSTEPTHERDENMLDFDGFSVDLQGGYVTNLEDTDGDEIFYSRRLINGKFRGGSHVCLPQFGPDGAGVLAQHGFGRNRLWEARGANTDTSVQLELYGDTGDESYKAMQGTVKYSHEGDAFISQLLVENIGEEGDFIIAPAFHPYFAIDKDNGKVVLDGVELNLQELAGTKYVDGSRHELIIGTKRLLLSSLQLQRWAVWTDNPEEYVCVEPSLVGDGFADPKNVVGDRIAPGQSKMYGYRISW